MKKRKIIEISVTGALFVILLLVLSSSLNKISQKRLTAGRDAKEQTPMKTPGQDLLKKQEEVSVNLELKRDPFTAASIAAIQSLPSAPHLNGILWDKNSPMAIVDNAVVKRGDRIGDKVVIDIKQNKVILSDGTQNIELKLGEEAKPQEE